MTTLYTAKKYAVPALEAHCVEFLKKNLRADNAFMLLTQVREPGWGPGGGWVGISQLLTPCRVPLAPCPWAGPLHFLGGLGSFWQAGLPRPFACSFPAVFALYSGAEVGGAGRRSHCCEKVPFGL